MAASTLAPWRVLNRAFRILGEDGLTILLTTALVYVVPVTLLSDWLYRPLRDRDLFSGMADWQVVALPAAAYLVTWVFHGLRFGIAGQRLVDRWRGKQRGPLSWASAGLAGMSRMLWLYVPVTAVSTVLLPLAWGIPSIPILLIWLSLLPACVFDRMTLPQAWRFSLSVLKGRFWLIVMTLILMDGVDRATHYGLEWAMTIAPPSMSDTFREWVIRVPFTALAETFSLAWLMSLFLTAREQTMGKVDAVEVVFE